MAMRYGMAGSPRPDAPGNSDDGTAVATRCLDVWEWEGGACGESVDAALDPHATLVEYPSTDHSGRGGWRFLAAAGRSLFPHGHWPGFLALGAGLVAVGLLARPR